jgi:RAB protein geranylgeranyltransferase component A
LNEILKTISFSRHVVTLLGDVFGTSSKVSSEIIFKIALSISSGIAAAAD